MESNSPALLKVENLSKKFLIKKSLLKKEFFKAVDNVSFSLGYNQVLGIVGESGSGKSTIGRLILKLIKKDEGKIEFEGKDIYSLTGKEEKLFRKETSIVFQDPKTSLNPRFKIRQIIEEPLLIHGFPKKERKERVKTAIKDAGLDESFLDRYPSELSGGQRQRVAIARAIVLDPKMIVADEPTSALDVSVQLQIINLIKKLRTEKKISFLFISHDLNVVGMLSDRILVLYRGKIMEKGDARDILKKPAHPYTKILLDSLPPEHPKDRKKLDYLPEVYREEVEGGCVFYSRCPIATDICKKEPQYTKIDNREVYCHFA
ncbi:peptide/nickel transport system ATP-binding protein/oligopeptide transport system ATP-binding protein [Persephonella hydrogeniphila]|uniref:Peptide/nickel transport system ATP-binding protein/oligopeptide transport system ATP-binding protein n=1 Tax=Persephonella hydrogeniphila TaxID=198703 RepID=A0A285N5B3_9AQUI|nr:ABC transporter ATP-binding protein [Persephonella hydrogeniphila]SNZ04037.1 peptide/nickel transport system ATP-binding protein/oligopeptide transport system ATP-binding protein [Persephonella hydrogeniphila]